MLFWGSQFLGTVKLDTTNKLTCVSSSVVFTQQKENTSSFLREENRVRQGNNGNRNLLIPAHKHEEEGFTVDLWYLEFSQEFLGSKKNFLVMLVIWASSKTQRISLPILKLQQKIFVHGEKHSKRVEGCKRKKKKKKTFSPNPYSLLPDPSFSSPEDTIFNLVCFGSSSGYLCTSKSRDYSNTSLGA